MNKHSLVPLPYALYSTLFLLSGLLTGTAWAAPHATVRINAAGPGRAENPQMWGLFIENICHDVDGGLYAQMIQNPDFKNDIPPADCKVVNGKWISPDGHIHNPPRGGPLLAWKSIHPMGTTVRLKLQTSRPLSPSHRLSVQVIASGRAAGLANTGYWGMPLDTGKSYQISFYARTAQIGAVPLKVKLSDVAGTRQFAQHLLSIAGSTWKRYTCRLTATGTTRHGALEFLTTGPAIFNLNLIQMFPVSKATGRPEFFRHDIVRLLARLHAGFLRVPGGNFIEGYSLADSYNWRKTVGPMIDRPGHVNYWGYRDTDGFGFMGWMKLAHRIGTAPLYCTSAGLLWNSQTIPGTKLQPFIHQMLTAVAFANDPVSSRWGKLRAKFGHPLPFGIKWVEIGNENGGPSYYHNYPIMARALGKAFPDMRQIADDWGGVPPGHLKIIDQHFYFDQQWFLNNYHRYDSVPRRGTDIFVGEYAVGNTKARYGDFRSTLAETAFMIGMERNCDLVRLASYGVTLDNAGAGPCRINLIEFNNTSAFGRSMYWVQYMFNHNRPAEIVPTRIRVSGYAGTGPHPQRFFADAGLTADMRTLIIKMDNPSARPMPVTLRLNGFTRIAPGGTAYVLHESNPGLDNTFRHPNRVVPRKQTVRSIDKMVHYTAEPFSITVVRLAVTKAARP